MGRPDETGDERGCRDRRRPRAGADLLDLPGPQDHDLVGERHGLDLIVGDVNHRRAHRRWSAVISSRICTRSSASRFDSGSSNRNTSGLRTIARPIATRCRWPPDNSLGLRLSKPSSGGSTPLPRPCRATSALAHSVHAQAEANVLLDAHVRVKRIGLEHHRDPALRGIEIGHVARRRSGFRRRYLLEPGDHSSSVDFPHPDGPTKTTNSPSSTFRLTSRTTSTDPNDFDTPLRSSSDIQPLTPLCRPRPIPGRNSAATGAGARSGSGRSRPPRRRAGSRSCHIAAGTPPFRPGSP